MGKKILIFGGIIGTLFLMIVVCYFLIISGMLFSFLPNPPKPEVLYGEFNFKLTYQVNHEIKEVKDIIVCEFDGFENLGTAGKRRKWKAKLKSGKERLVLLHQKQADKEIVIYSSYGMPEYYMGDLIYISDDYEKMMSVDKELGYIEYVNGVKSGKTITADDAMKNFGIKIIDIQYDEPIDNNFR